MNTIDVKEQVRRAIAAQWPEFAAAHPRLAEAIDQSLLVDQAMQSLADDAEFTATMEKAAQIGAAAEAVSSMIAQTIGRWLRQLV